MNQEKIGKFICELRKEKNWTQYDLAEKAIISRQAVSKWERGVTIPDSSTLLILSQLFDVTINELLLGERINSKDNNTKENMEKVTLGIVDDYINNKRKLKRIIKILIIVVIVLLNLFLIYYFINSYNSIKVYMINGDNDNFVIKDGILVMTKSKIYFSLGDISSKNNMEIKSIELFSKINNKKKNIYFNDESSILLKDYYGYNAYFDYESIDKIINSLYVTISYSSTSETIHLKTKKDFSNSNFLFLKSKEIVSKSNDSDNSDNNIKIDTNDLEKEIFKSLSCSEYECILKDAKEDLSITYLKDQKLLNIYINDSKKMFEWNYFLNQNLLNYKEYSNDKNITEMNINLNSKNHKTKEKKCLNDFNYYINQYLK